MKELNKKCETLEQELNHVRKKLSEEHENNKNIKNSSDGKSKLIQTNLEQENSCLKKRFVEFEQRAKENEKLIENLRNKEIIIEKLNRSLESELNELKVINVNSELQQQKLHTIEHANHILEQELDSLKKKHDNEFKMLSEVINQQKIKLKNYENIEELNKRLSENLNNHQQSNQIIEMKLREENELLKADIGHLVAYENKCKTVETKMFESEQEIHKLMKMNETLEKENLNLKNLSQIAEKEFDEKLKTLKHKDIENLKLLHENELTRKNDIVKSVENENENLKNALVIRNEEIICLKQELNNLNTNHDNEMGQKLNELMRKNEKLHEESNNLKKIIVEERDDFNKQKDIQLIEYENIGKKLNTQISKNDELVKNSEDLTFELNEYKIKYEKIAKDYESLLKSEEDKANQLNLDDIDKIKVNYEALQSRFKSLNDKFLMMVS